MQEELQQKEQKLKAKAIELKNRLGIELSDEIVQKFNTDCMDWFHANTKETWITNSERTIYIEQAAEKILDMQVQLFEINNTITGNYNYGASEYSITFYEKFIEQRKQELDQLEKNLKNELNRINKGSKGEDYAASVLDVYLHKYKILYNVILPVKDKVGVGKTVEIDAVIITKNRIFVCEVKNYGGEETELYIDCDGEFTLYDLNTKKVVKNYEKSPSQQNIRQALLVEKFLTENFPAKSIEVHPVVIIANDDVKIKNDSEHQVKKSKQLYYYFSSFPDNNYLDEEMQNQLVDCFKRHQQPARKFSIVDIEAWSKKCDELQEKLAPYVEYNKQMKILYDEYLEIMEKFLNWKLGETLRQNREIMEQKRLTKEKEFREKVYKEKAIQEQQRKEIAAKEQMRQNQEENKLRIKAEKEKTTVEQKDYSTSNNSGCGGCILVIAIIVLILFLLLVWKTFKPFIIAMLILFLVTFFFGFSDY